MLHLSRENGHTVQLSRLEKETIYSKCLCIACFYDGESAARVEQAGNLS